MTTRPLGNVSFYASLCLLGWATLAWGEDLLTGIVPLEPARLRNAFLDAAGPDSEISKEEFQQDQASADGFVRSFDKWDSILEFDADSNEKIAWSEARNYRQDQQKKLIAGFDENGDLRLRGAEREKALAAVKAGRLDPEEKPRAGQGAQASTLGRKIQPEGPLARYDADKDGVLSPEEIRQGVESVKLQWRKERLARFDTDRDGQLSDQERRAMRESFRKDSKSMQDWLDQRFDLDGDGKLGPAESEVLQEVGKSMQTTMKRLADRIMDANGDGEVTKLEKASVAMAWSQEAQVLILQSQAWIDTDADGRATWQEQRDFRSKATGAIRDWFDRFAVAYDRDNDGKFNQAEARALMTGLDRELERRVKLADADEDGSITPREGMAALERFGRETGVIPSGDATEAPAGSDSP